MAKYPAIPEPTTDPASLRDAVLSLKQAFEILTGQRGNADNAALTSQALSGLINANDLTTAIDEINVAVDAVNTALSGKVTGPTSATDNALVRFDGTTGKLVQDSQVTLSDSDGKLTRAAGISVSGTNTNDNAASGYVGEIVEYTLSSTSLTSGAAAVNLANGAFSAGDWEIEGFVYLGGVGATVLTSYTFSIGSTSATHDTSAIERFITLRNANGIADPYITQTIGPMRRALSGSTTLYLVGNATFSTSLSVSTKIRGRRVR